MNNYLFKIMQSFRPMAMKKGELARLYFPDSTTAVGTNRLMRWIHHCVPLMNDLEQTGYRHSQKLLTARQVSIIVRHLGEP